MAVGQELQFMLNLKMMYSGTGAQQAGAAMKNLQDKTSGLQKVVGDIESFSKQQEAINKTAQRLDEARAAYANNDAAVAQSRTAQETARVSLDASKLKLGELNATLKENVANYQAQQLTVNQAGLDYKNITAQGAQVTGEIAQRLEDARQKLSVLGETLPRTSAEYRVQASEVRRLESEYASATAQSKAQSAEALSRYKAEQAKLRELSQTVSKSSKEYKAQQAVVKKLQTEYKQSVNETRQFEAEQKRLAASVSKAEENLAKEQTAAGELAGKLEAAGVNTKNLASEQERLSAAINKADAAQKNYQAIREKLTWQNFSGDLMSAYASAKTLQVPIKIDMEFEQAMANVRAVMGDLTDEQFSAMRMQAMELGSTTQFSATQAASTQETLARAGFDQQKITDMLQPLMDMAAAEGMDLAQGATILSGAIRGYSSMGITSADSQKLVDILAFTSKSTNTGIADVGEAFKQVAATASTLHISPEQLASYIGTLANQNVQGSEAGVALANALMRLSAPSTEAAKELQRLKVRTKTRNGELVEIPEIIKQIFQATEKLGDTGRVAAFENIFGKQGARPILALGTGIMSGEQATLEQATYTERNGTAASMAQTRNDTLKGDIVSLGSAWEGLMINIGNALEPINRFVTQTLTTGIQKVNEFMTEHQTLAVWAARVGAFFAGWKVLSTVYTYGSLLVKLPFAKIAVSLAAGQAEAVAAGTAMQSTGGIFSAVFAGIKTAASSAWGLIAAHPFLAIGAAVAGAAVLIYQNWDKIKEKFGVVADYCREKWQALSDWWDSWNFPEDVWPVMKNEYARTLDGLKNLWGKLSDWWASWEFPDIFAGLGELFSNALDGLKNIWASFVDWLSGLNPFKGWGDAANAGIKTAISHIPDKQVDNAAIALNTWGIPGFATGGIIDKPSVIQVAESGREAIIPLTDKARGIPLLMTAAQELGVVSGEESATVSRIKSANNFASGENVYDIMQGVLERRSEYDILRGPDNFYGGSSNRIYDRGDFSPVINIQVEGNATPSVAEDIARKVREVLSEMASYNERVAYA